MERPSYRCSVCGKQGRDVEPGPDAMAEAKQLFALHLDRHTQPELAAFVWKIMYDHGANAGILERL